MKSFLTKWSFSLFLVFGLTAFGVAQKKVSGTVTDASNGDALIGANVLVKGSGTGTITDVDGTYSLSASEGDVLVFSYAGYTDQEVVVGASSTVNVSLSAGKLLDEVVVVGYGTQKSKEVTGSVVSVKREDFNAGNVNSPAQLLQGRVAGLTVSRPNGDPNGSFGIRLRGLSTIGAQTEPLIIVDGVPGASLNNIDPQDIESFDVLKDGSAAAIYGTRGSSGVILITTKKGKKGTSKIEYNGYLANESIAKLPSFLNTSEYKAAGGIDAGAETDWYGELSQSKISQSHNLSLSGGAGNTSYRASFNFRDMSGVVLNTGFKQLNGSLSLNQKAMNDKLNVGINMILTNRDSKFGFPEAFRYASLFNPTSRVYLENGNYNNPTGFDVFNPVSIANQINEGVRSELLANITASYEIISGLKLTGTYARQKSDRLNGEYYAKNAVYRQGVARKGVALRSTEVDVNNLYETTLSYTAEANKLTYTIMAGLSSQDFNFQGQGINAGGFLLDAFTYNNIGTSSEVLTGLSRPYSYNNGYELQAQFARLNFNYDNTYFLAASVRREGSDRFGQDNKYGIFPAISAGVDITKLANFNNVDNLKLRVGYGVTGNLPGQSYLGYSIFSPGAQFFYDGAFVPSYGPTTNANPDLKWETKGEINVGLDYSFYNSKITGALDVFQRKTSDLILFTRVPVPPNLAPNTWKNSAGFTTSGIELSVNYDLISKSNFSYTPTLIFTSYRTNLDTYLEDTPSQFITNLGAPGQNIIDAGVGLHLLEEGKPIGQIVAPKWDGKSVDAEGRPVFIDTNGDEKYVEKDDWVVVGNGLPDFELSLNNAFTFGKFDANLFFRGAFGHSLVHENRAFYETNPAILSGNVIRTELYNPAVKVASYNETHVEKADFVRLDNATLGYNVTTKGKYFSSARIFVAGQNLFTITGYTGVDPDVRLGDAGSQDNGGRLSTTLNPLAPGVDRRSSYYTTRTLTIGLNLGF
jgi:iron complex outermembrane receptor protein